MFLWIALGAGVTDADEILDLLAEHRVVVVPGEPDWPCTILRPFLDLLVVQLWTALAVRCLLLTYPLLRCPSSARFTATGACGVPQAASVMRWVRGRRDRAPSSASPSR